MALVRSNASILSSSSSSRNRETPPRPQQQSFGYQTPPYPTYTNNYFISNQYFLNENYSSQYFWDYPSSSSRPRTTRNAPPTPQSRSSRQSTPFQSQSYYSGGTTHSTSHSHSSRSTRNEATARGQAAEVNLGDVIDLDLSCHSFTCFGFAHTQRRRCRNPIAAHNQQAARALLVQGSKKLVSGRDLDDLLSDLASAVLCRQWHQDQIGDFTSQWSDAIAKYRESLLDAEEEEEEAAEVPPPPPSPPARRRAAPPTPSQLRPVQPPTPSQLRPAQPPTPPARHTIQAPTTQSTTRALARAPAPAPVPAPVTVTVEQPRRRRRKVQRKPIDGQDCHICFEPLIPVYEDSSDEEGDDDDDDEEENDRDNDSGDDSSDDDEEEENHNHANHRPDPPLVWCRAQCGTNFHQECIETWLESCDSRADQGTTRSCPYCRAKWRGGSGHRA